jgi:hypothetical protein
VVQNKRLPWWLLVPAFLGLLACCVAFVGIPNPRSGPEERADLLYQAAGRGDSAAVERIVRAGFLPENAVDLALINATSEGQLATARILVPKASAQGKDDALWTAAARGDRAAVQYFLKQGADPNGSSYGRAARVALERGHEEVARILRRAGGQE